MKRFFTAAVLLLSVMLFAAENYRVLVFGDIHFEHAKYHGVPGIKYSTRREIVDRANRNAIEKSFLK